MPEPIIKDFKGVKLFSEIPPDEGDAPERPVVRFGAWERVEINDARRVIMERGRPLDVTEATSGSRCAPTHIVATSGIDTNGDGVADQLVETESFLSGYGCDDVSRVNVTTYFGPFSQALWYRDSAPVYNRVPVVSIGDTPLITRLEEDPTREYDRTSNASTLGVGVYFGDFLGKGTQQIAIMDAGAVEVFEWRPAIYGIY